jgi:hypothetical protein
LSERKYGKVLYSIYTLKKKYQNNKFLDIGLTKAWYGLIVYKNRGRYDEVTENTSMVQGESYPLHLFLNALDMRQLNAIGLRYIYDNLAKYHNSELITEYFKKCKSEVINHSTISIEDFKNHKFIDTLKQHSLIEITNKFDTNSIESSTSYKSTFKFDFEKNKKDNQFDFEKNKKDNQFKLKKPEYLTNRNIKFNTVSNKQILIPGEKEFYLYVFHDLVRKNELNDLFKDTNYTPATYESSILIEDRCELIESDGEWINTNIKKLLIVNPNYADFGMTNSKKLVKSERKRVKISKYYEEEYKNLQLERILLDIRSLDSTQVDKFNHISIINAWATELAEHKDIDMISSTHDKMKVINTKYDLSNVLFSEFISFKDHNKWSNKHSIMVGLLYFIPVAIIDVMIIHNYFFHISAVLDSKNDKIKYIKIQNVNLKAGNKIVRTYIFNFFKLISQ